MRQVRREDDLLKPRAVVCEVHEYERGGNLPSGMRCAKIQAEESEICPCLGNVHEGLVVGIELGRIESQYEPLSRDNTPAGDSVSCADAETPNTLLKCNRSFRSALYWTARANSAVHLARSEGVVS